MAKVTDWWRMHRDRAPQNRSWMTMAVPSTYAQGLAQLVVDREASQRCAKCKKLGPPRDWPLCMSCWQREFDRLLPGRTRQQVLKMMRVRWGKARR